MARRFAVVAMASLSALSVLPLASASAKPGRPRVVLPAVAPVEPDALTEALQEGQLSHAEYALHRARSVFTLGAVREEFGDVERVDPHAATLILRDLALRTESLSGEDRAVAIDILERPTQGGATDPYLEYTVEEATPIETAHFRIHYVTSTQDQSTLAYATEISALMEQVWTQEVTDYGWTAPKSDGTRGGGQDKFDVYLGNVGAVRVYGYCSTDLGQIGTSHHSYCVLDNGFTEFTGPVTGFDAAKVTAAHEFNHALQFTYDVTDDYWLSESTATWMEDEVFDSINDNYQYLPSSSLARPQTPADTWTDFFNPDDLDTGFQYGQFIWMRYLSEASGDPSIVRRIWEEAAKPGVYSLAAMETVLGGRSQFADSFAGFATANAKASRFYEEGTAYEEVVPSVRNSRYTIAEGVPVKGGVSDMDHLTSRYVSFTPGTGVVSDELTLAVDMGSSRLQRATVVSLDESSMATYKIPLTDGEGRLTVPFGSQSEVVLVLTNASNRMANCTRWFPGSFSCGGTPVHDNRAAVYSAVTGANAVDPGEPVERDTNLGPRVQNFRATPEVFSPNGDGRRDRTKIVFDLLDSSKITLSVVRNGTVIGYFNRNEALEGGYRYLTMWNGRKPSGQRVKNGTYTLKLKAVGPTGTTTKKTSVTVRR